MSESIEDVLRTEGIFHEVTIIDVDKHPEYRPGMHMHLEYGLGIYLCYRFLKICYSGQFQCEPVDMHIEELVLQCPVSSVPEFLFDRASAIWLPNSPRCELPEKYRHKLKHTIYM